MLKRNQADSTCSAHLQWVSANLLPGDGWALHGEADRYLISGLPGLFLFIVSDCICDMTNFEFFRQFRTLYIPISDGNLCFQSFVCAFVLALQPSHQVKTSRQGREKAPLLLGAIQSTWKILCSGGSTFGHSWPNQESLLYQMSWQLKQQLLGLGLDRADQEIAR